MARHRKTFTRASVLALIAGLGLVGCSNPDRVSLESPNQFDRKAKDAIQDSTNGGFSSDPVLQGEIPNWFTKDPSADGVEGMSVDRAYTELGLKPGQKIVVAVIDSGVDINHEDLKKHIWVNKGEIPNNQIDDDKNGYVDDVNGWNFIGGHDAAGKNVNIEHENLEETREVVRLKKLKVSQGGLSKDDKAYLAVLTKFIDDKRTAALGLLKDYTPAQTKLLSLYNQLKPLLKIEYAQVTLAGLQTLATSNDDDTAAKTEMIQILKTIKAASIATVQARITAAQVTIDFYVNEKLNVRKKIVGDDPYNYNDNHYGNNDVTGGDPHHGTHVSGMITAERSNGIGIEGVTNDVEIMSVRTVPDGDERDKDVANAVRYAVDNGARVINMSFGKNYSPGKPAVDAAFAYAEAHGVLLVHAAGNDNKDNDTAKNFPNHNLVDPATRNIIRQVSTWMEIGASSSKKGTLLPAQFSNYGQWGVDIFAPGVRIYSSIPGNRYAVYSGTSMASPATAGVAALILSQHPSMTALQVKAAMLNSARLYDGLMVQLPGSGVQDPANPGANPIEAVFFSRLSATGGIVDALRTLKSLSGVK